MSSVVKGVKKIFKKVVDVVKKVVPIVLAIAAVYFTAGAALGWAGAAGGWSAAAGTISTGLGATAGSTLGGALTGAIYSAGVGAAVGGIGSELTGGSFTEGAQRGAASGAVLGGIMGAANPARYGQGTRFNPDAPPTSNVPTELGPGSQGAPPPQPGDPNPMGLRASGPAEITSGGVTTTAPPETVGTAGRGGSWQADTGGNAAANLSKGGGAITPTQAPVDPTAGKGLLGKGGWLERNQELAGGLIKGWGEGMAASGLADAEADAARRRSENYAGQNYGDYRSLAPGTGGKPPTERFSPGNYGSWQYAYNPETGRIERVPADNG